MAIPSRKLFVDTSVLIAFIDRGDANHEKAAKAMEGLAKLEYQLYTSLQCVQDTYAVVDKEVGTSIALELLQSALQSDMEILFPQKVDLITSYRIVRGNIGRQVTLKEALNATLMQKRGISQILTFSYWHNLLGTHVTNITV